MAPKKPTSQENEYFAREEARRQELAQIEREQQAESTAREARRGTCPGGCATKLVEEAFRDILIDRCPTCGGVWLDPGELDKISSDDAGLIRSAFTFLRGG